ncbi:glycosyltransferase [Thermodesulfobacteriota bacterium]
MKKVKRKNNKKILMICYYYPPLMDVACKRSVAFAKYFKKYGLKPFVLSVKNPDRNYCIFGNDIPPSNVETKYCYSIINPYKFLGQLNGLVSRVLRICGIGLKRNYLYDLFCIPDVFLGWIPLTVLTGYLIIKRNKIEIIYVSCPPFSSAIIGVVLKFLVRKPLVTDFRDAYSIEDEKLKWLEERPTFRKKIDKFIESKILKYSDLFITVNMELAEKYAKQHPQVSDHIRVIYNGVEQENFEFSGKKKYKKFTIVYSGNYYFFGSRKEIFFEAIYLIKNEKIIDSNTFQALFYGSGENEIIELAKKWSVEDLVKVHKRVSQKKVFLTVSKAHLNFVRAVPAAVPIKILEGIALNTPMLALVENEEAVEIIKKHSPSSLIIKDDGANDVKNAILQAMRMYNDDNIINNKTKEFFKKFSRESQTKKMLNYINTLFDGQ